MGWPAQGKVVRHQAGLPGLLWEVSGTHPGAAPMSSGGPPELLAERGETLVLPTEGSGSKGGKEGEPSWFLILRSRHWREAAVGAGTFLSSRRFWETGDSCGAGRRQASLLFPPLGPCRRFPKQEALPSAAGRPPSKGSSPSDPRPSPPVSSLGICLRPQTLLRSPLPSNPSPPPPLFSPPSEPLAPLGPSPSPSDLRADTRLLPLTICFSLRPGSSFSSSSLRALGLFHPQPQNRLLAGALQARSGWSTHAPLPRPAWAQSPCSMRHKGPREGEDLGFPSNRPCRALILTSPAGPGSDAPCTVAWCSASQPSRVESHQR